MNVSICGNSVQFAVENSVETVRAIAKTRFSTGIFARLLAIPEKGLFALGAVLWTHVRNAILNQK